MTLREVLERAAAWNPSKRITFVRGRGVESSITHGDLLSQATAVAAWLRAQGVCPRDLVILAPASNETFVRGFWGCVFAGAIPVPLPSPNGALHGSSRERFENVSRLLDEPRVIVDAIDVAVEPGHSRFLRLPSQLPSPWTPSAPDAEPSDAALIQFSSGSTGTPKGIVLTHGNVLANLRAMRDGARVTPDDVSVNWTPLSHDLGLIGFLLGAIYCPNDLVLIDIQAFVRRPLLWLDVLDAHRATITSAPNFGQSLMLTRLAESAAPWQGDLSRVRVVINGAEPISAGVMNRFMDALAPHGLRREAMFPVYGLAEATLAVTFPAPGGAPIVATCDRRALRVSDPVVRVDRTDPHATEVVGVGSAVDGCELRIVDDADRVLDEDTTGHVQVRGANVTAGYHADVGATQAAFSDAWLRTGDLGFVHAGQLYVTGRAKDILFVNGQNFYANDIERVALLAPGGDGRRIAACGWRAPEDAADRLLLFVSSANPDPDAGVFAAIRHQLQGVLGLTPHAIIPLPSSRFPRTTSGKVQRYRLREQFERGEFAAAIDRVRRAFASPEGMHPDVIEGPRTATERAVHAIWARELGLAPAAFGVHDRFAEMGGTSLNAMVMRLELEDRFGVSLSPESLARYPTVGTMAEYLDRGVSLVRLPGARRTIFRG
jgi:acyl-CoA synthetase (AMP-forming)/AMP-acid ligase II/acyl carrier protein